MHVARCKLGLSEDDYRAILQRQAGVASSANLDNRGFMAVMRHMTALGFRSDWTKRTFGNRPGMASPAQIDMIRGLWRDYHGDDDKDRALNAWLIRFHKVEALRFLDGELAGKVITGLKVMAGRNLKSNLKAIQSP